MGPYQHTIMQRPVQIEDEDDQESDTISETVIHLIVILPFGGHVWKIDSYNTNGPLDLGLCGASWTTVTATRLQIWHDIAAATEILVDIPAISKSPRAFYTTSSHSSSFFPLI